MRTREPVPTTATPDQTPAKPEAAAGTSRPRWRRWLLAAIREIGAFVGGWVTVIVYVAAVWAIADWMMDPTHPDQTLPSTSRLYGGAALMLSATCALLLALAWQVGLFKLWKARRGLLEAYRNGCQERSDLIDELLDASRRNREADRRLADVNDRLHAAKDERIALLEQLAGITHEGDEDDTNDEQGDPR